MKIFLGSNPPHQHYLNLGYRKNLDDHCESAEATEIYAPEMMDYIDFDEKDGFIKHLISKLRHGATLTLGGTDVISISLATFNKTLTIEQTNKLIYGEKTQPQKKGLSCLEDMRKLLLANGLRIEKQIPGLQFIIVASRP